MMRDDDSYDEDDDWEAEADESEDTCPCPYCGRQVYDDAERCPYCEQYLSGEDAPASPKSLWIVVGVVVALGLIFWWTLGGR